MNHKYTQLAWTQAVWEELIQVLQNKYLSEDRKIILCEKTAFKDREVPEDVVHEAMRTLCRMSDMKQKELDKFDFVEKEEEDEAATEVRDGPSEKPAAKAANPPPRKPGTKPGGSGSSN